MQLFHHVPWVSDLFHSFTPARKLSQQVLHILCKTVVRKLWVKKRSKKEIFIYQEVHVFWDPGTLASFTSSFCSFYVCFPSFIHRNEIVVPYLLPSEVQNVEVVFSKNAIHFLFFSKKAIYSITELHKKNPNNQQTNRFPPNVVPTSHKEFHIKQYCWQGV